MIRSVSLVDRLVLEFSGNHFAHALAIGDVDSDGVSRCTVSRNITIIVNIKLLIR